MHDEDKDKVVVYTWRVYTKNTWQEKQKGLYYKHKEQKNKGEGK